MILRASLVASLALMFACDSDSSSPDTSDTSDTGDTSDTSDTSDTGDTGDTSAETDTADADTSDTSPTGPIAAVPGARCKLSERVGLIEIEAQGPSAVYLNGAVADRPNPYFGEPELSDAACAFHRFSPQSACAPCGEEELCAVSDACVKAPIRRPDARVVVATGAKSIELVANTETGEIFGELPVGAEGAASYSVSLFIGDQEVTVGATAIPGALNASGTLTGDSMQPDGLTATWTAQAGDSQVFTHIPINHHASGPTFTECVVPVASGTLSIAGAMLRPLSVVTGLEFQGLEHQHVAAAELASGCVEFRFLVREFTPLFER